MAKTQGPLMSEQASGTLGGAITFTRQGIAHTPNSPGSQSTANRGNARQIFKAISQALTHAAPSTIAAIRAATDCGPNWRAYMLDEICGAHHVIWDATQTLWLALTSTQRTYWDTVATSQSYAITSLAYATDPAISAGQSMWQIASALYNAAIITAPGQPEGWNAAAWAHAISAIAYTRAAGSRTFNGATDRLDWSSIYNPTGQAITLSLWIYFNALAHASYVVTINNSLATFGLVLWVTSSTALQLYRGGTTNLFRTSTNAFITTGSWLHLLATHTGTFNDATTIKLYKHGIEPGSYTGTNGATAQALSGTWSIGGRLQDDARNCNAQIAQVAVWDRVLSSTEISALAAGHAPITYPSGLRFYYPGDTAALVDDVTAATATADGTAISASGPTILYP